VLASMRRSAAEGGCLKQPDGEQLSRRTKSNLSERLHAKVVLAQKARRADPATLKETAGCKLEGIDIKIVVPGRSFNIHIHIDELSTVRKVKQILCDIIGIAIEDQQLLFGDTRLLDRTTLRKAGVVGGSILHLMFALTMGGFFDAVTKDTDPSTLEDGEKGKKTPSDFSEHCAFVNKEFEYHSCIEKCEERAMTLRQVKEINSFAGAHCGDWKDVSTYKNNGGVWVKGSPKFGETPSMDWLNLYVMNMWVIMPGCKAQNCSFVELRASRAQPPKWFCSHWWGERVLDFQASLTVHAQVRNYTEDTTYWVCAYANRQWAIAGEGISVDPKETPFYKAMHVAKASGGGTLVVLDKEAIAFSRIWCAFEESITLNEQLTIDISTCLDGKAYLITEEPIQDGADKSSPKTMSADNKMNREKDFPLHVLKIGLGLNLETAKASVETDRTHILNSIAARPVAEFSKEPPKSHDNYDMIDAKLRSTFAQAAYRQIIDAGEDEDVKLFDILAADRWRTKLSMSFGRCNALTDHKVAQLANALSPSLQHLILNLSSTAITDAALLAIMPKLPKSINYLEFHVNACASITDKGVEAIANGLHELENMIYLKLGLAWVHVLTDATVALVGEKLGTKKGKGMIWFFMNFAHSEKLTDAGIGALLDHLPPTMTGMGFFNAPHWSPQIVARITDANHKMASRK